MAAVGVSVQVVRVDVEGNEADGREGRRVDDGHVVGGVDADGGDIGAGTGAHVGNAILERGGGEEEGGRKREREEEGSRIIQRFSRFLVCLLP